MAAAFKPVERGWCLGGESFREELLAAGAERLGAAIAGRSTRRSAGAKAGRLVRAGLQALGWTEKELATRRKGDKAKVKLARRLRAGTTMTLRWTADRLHMGSWICVSNLLHEKPQKPISVNSED